MSLGPSATQSPIELDGLDRGAAEGHVYALKEIDRARSADATVVFTGSPPVPADLAYVPFCRRRVLAVEPVAASHPANAGARPEVLRNPSQPVRARHSIVVREGNCF